MPLWVKLLKVNGFLVPPGLWFEGFSSWLFTPGFSTVSADQDQLWLKTLANLEGEGKMSIEDFSKLLGSSACAEPTIIDEAVKMLETVAMVAKKLAGGHHCIASIGYKYAAELMIAWARSIADNMSRGSLDRFLVRILHKVNQEMQVAFWAIYVQVCDAQEAAFFINPSVIATIFYELRKMFDQIVRHQVSDFLFPVSLDTVSSQETKNDNEQTLIETVTKKQKRLEKNNTA